MARENKRKREERRYGRAERLVDLIRTSHWVNAKPFITDIEPVKAALDISYNVVADNVAEYWFNNRVSSWDFTELPACRPPYDSLFVEAPMPSRALLKLPGSRYGILFRSTEINELTDLRPTPFGENFNGSKLDPKPRDLLSRCAVAVEYSCIVQQNYRRAPFVYVIFKGFFLLDRLGLLLARPGLDINDQFYLDWAKEHGFDDNPDGVGAYIATEYLYPMTLAVAFMNCKNVSLPKHEPDAHLNLDRKRAKLKPFLRYHTINIEPMKAVLRAEGGVDTDGLKKALHICRGHFATYTPDKPLFGHFSGTVWKPSHVRGSAKQGVIISDYDVKPPGGPHP